jgi:ubiquinone/menaquinone biosynthesis C-methylase UbiE
MSKKDFFDRHAHKWDELYYQTEPAELKDLIREFQIRKGDWILDVGTGTGILLPYLSRLTGKEGKLFALDFSSEMLSVAKSKLTQSGIEFIDSDVGNMPFENEIFDRVICLASFPHFGNKPKSLQEMSRVLKKGGMLFIAHLLSSLEIKEHHSGAGEEVKDDVLPENSSMIKMMSKAKLKRIKIVDQPSLYLAQGEKC